MKKITIGIIAGLMSIGTVVSAGTTKKISSNCCEKGKACCFPGSDCCKDKK